VISCWCCYAYARVAKLSFFLAPVRLRHFKKKCVCCIEIWQLRACVDSFQRYNEYNLVCSGWNLFVKCGIHSTKLPSLTWMNCGHLRFTILLLHGSVDCTILRPSVVTRWLMLPFLAFYLVATRSPCSCSTSYLSYFCVNLQIEVTWHCFLWALLHAVCIFPHFTVLHMCVRVWHNRIISNMIDYCSTCCKHFAHFMHALQSMFNVMWWPIHACPSKGWNHARVCIHFVRSLLLSRGYMNGGYSVNVVTLYRVIMQFLFCVY